VSHGAVVEDAGAHGSSPINRRPRTNAELNLIDGAIVDVVAADHPMTLRGAYYRVLSLGLIEKNERAYRLVGRQLLKLRRAGLVPYSWITDGTRWITKPRTWGDLDQMLNDAAASYRRALWQDQDVDVHGLIEKDAISGVILPVIDPLDVPLGMLRGYASESFAHSVAEELRLSDWPTFISQLGDHDPSGLDAWRDFQRKVTAFATDADVVFERLTPEQIENLGLPTRPTKRSDSRPRAFDGGSVEVDAVPPRLLREIVEAAIEQHVDREELRLTRIADDSERELLYAICGQVAS
jgi:hypothetical protein